MKKINVLQLTTSLGIGGAENVIFDICKNIDKNKFNVYVKTLMNTRIELVPMFQQNGIDTSIIGVEKNPINFFKKIFSVRRFLKEKNIQIIHAHMFHALLFASILKLTYPSVKIVWTSHSLKIGSKVREFIAFIMKPLRDTDILLSNSIKKFFYKKKNIIISNGIDIDKFNFNINKNSKFTFITVGRLEYVKNHIFLIEIFKKVDFECQLLIVGQGELKKELQEKINNYGLQEKIKLLGARSDVPQLLKSSNCFLLPSLWEGIPIVILEAATSNIPIVTTPVGGIPEVINDDEAYLVELEKFLETIVYVYNNYDEALERANKLNKKIKDQYSVDKNVSKHEKLYLRLVNE